jgi:rhodanese-related sulfurtransferase
MTTTSEQDEILATPEEIRTLLANDDTVILDVRGPEEILETGYWKTKRPSDGRPHRWIQLACTRTEAPLLELTMDSLLDAKDQPILIHCKSGKRAGLAKRVLEKAGYTNVWNAGGWSDVEPFVVKE